MLLDTGSSCTLVKKKLVPVEAYTGKFLAVQFADGSEKQVPVARVMFTSSDGTYSQEIKVDVWVWDVHPLPPLDQQPRKKLKRKD